MNTSSSGASAHPIASSQGFLANSGGGAVTTIDPMGTTSDDKLSAMANTRVKVIPVSANSPPKTLGQTTRHGTTRLSAPHITTTYMDSEADIRRSSVAPLDSQNPRIVSHRRRSYLRRRMDVWDSERDIPSSPSRRLTAGSISALPMAVQAGFRRKVLFIFDLQLLLLTGAIVLLTFEPKLATLMEKAFYSPWILLVAFAMMVVALSILYRVHSMYPWNWIAMVLFTGVFAVLVAGVQVILETYAGLFCSVFTFVAMCVMTVLCGVKRSDADGEVFLSSLVAGFLSYAIAAIVVAVVYGIAQWQFVSGTVLAYGMVIEFALIMWFSFDAATIFRLITPDEYMHGVIYFYTDVLVLTMISAAAVGLVLLCTACGGAGGGGGGFGYINPTGCSSGCCNCCGDDGPGDGTEDGEGREGEEGGGDGIPPQEQEEMARE